MSTDYAQAKAPARNRLLSLMSNLEWHTYKKLNRVAGVRYSARLLELKRLGYQIESRGASEDGKRYRLKSLRPGLPKGKQVKVFMNESDAVRLVGKPPRLTKQARLALSDALASFRTNKDKL